MKNLSNQNGFTYILALTLVIIMGIMLGMAGQAWKTIKQRELEEELIYRGDQIVELITQRALCLNGNQLNGLSEPTVNQFLLNVNATKGTIIDSLADNAITVTCKDKTTRKLRLRASVALDPMTGKPWKIITPVGFPNLFLGVASESNEVPFKKSFKDVYESPLLDFRNSYSDWTFIAELRQPLPTQQIQNQIQTR